MAIKLPCADGSDCNCWGRIEASVSESYWNLNKELQDEFDDLAESYVENGEDYYEEIGYVVVQAKPNTCGACGSDYFRDADGNIIFD
ncbi:hypothetical protein QMU85_003445 [Photobacterium damselae]|uniref:hypothetical protein n=1 Tax=Photobacterium damselae TaxID=38293 RepID=UPI002543DAA7|nr:hypothetical protein [Photobacterium damselae]